MILPLLRRRLSDLAHVALHGSDHREHAAIRYALRLPAGAPVLAGVVRALGLLEEARRLAHEHEARAKRWKALAKQLRDEADTCQRNEAAALRERDDEHARAGEWSRKFHEADQRANRLASALGESDGLLMAERAKAPSAVDIATAVEWIPRVADPGSEPHWHDARAGFTLCSCASRGRREPLRPHARGTRAR